MAVETNGSATTLFPNGGWDTHHHIFDRKNRKHLPQRPLSHVDVAIAFPYNAQRHLTPPAATIQQYETFKRDLGITRSVLAHGLSYGDDCSSLGAFVRQLGEHRTSSVAVIDPEKTTDDEIYQLNAGGTRGIRLNLYRYGAMDNVELQKKVLDAHIKRLQSTSVKWSIALTTTRTAAWDDLQAFIQDNVSQSGISLVTDHFACLKAPSMLAPEFQADPTQQPGFQSIMRLVHDGHLWVKLSAPYRASEQSPRYDDLNFLVRAFVDANKHRVVWGSDWPHTPRMKTRSHEEAMKETPFLDIDDETWLWSLRKWLSDEEWDLLMVQNPNALYGR